MKTRFQTPSLTIQEWIAQGRIGQVRAVHADLGSANPYEPQGRLWDPAQGGGALLDIGVYPVALAHQFLGAPDTVTAAGELAPTGVDASIALHLGYRDGRYAQIAATLTAEMPRRAAIIGTEGVIEIAPPFHHMSHITLSRRDGTTDDFRANTARSMVAELREVTGCITEGKTESTLMPWSATLEIMQIMDTALDQLGANHRDDTAAGVRHM